MVVVAQRQGLKQRADYTSVYNARSGRHGWLRLTPAYSVKMVDERIADGRGQRVLDPFCGSGTTALCVAGQGRACVTTDINPFLIWLARAKIGNYTASQLAATEAAGRAALALLAERAITPCPVPPIFNPSRWWSAPVLDFLRMLQAAILSVAPPDSPQRTLLQVAFCRTLIGQSNAAFDHQSMSFRDPAQLSMPWRTDLSAAYASDLGQVLSAASDNPSGESAVVLADARRIGDLLEGPFDRIVTSPPYANRMSYIRELRPYMYWLGYLGSGRDAGELDWTAIGGTWGVATSRLNDWQRPEDGFRSQRLAAALAAIANADNKNGPLLANYVGKYFEDIWQHVQSVSRLLAPGADVHYIVGNSSFYGTLVETERLYAEMFSAMGFTDVQCRPVRKRNSNKSLIEFDVSARWR